MLLHYIQECLQVTVTISEEMFVINVLYKKSLTLCPIKHSHQRITLYGLLSNTA